MKKVKRLSVRQESFMSEEEYAQYLKILRAKDEKSWMNTMNFSWRMRLHWILHILMKARYVYEYVINKYSSLLCKPFSRDKYIE